MPKDEQRYVIRSVSRALELLKTFSGVQSELSLAEISQRINLNRSTTFRLLVTLQAHGYVEQDQEARKYRLGVTCLELGSVFLNQSDIRKEALPILNGLRDDCKETVHLARLAGSEVVYLEKLEGLLPIGIMGSQVGRRAPAHCTGLGKAMLAYLPESEIRQLYGESGLRRFTPNTITDLTELRRELASIRERGFAIDNEEHEPEVKCVAVPIWNYRQKVVGAISVSGPAGRIDRAIAERGLVAKVKEAGQAISSRLAGDVESRG
ncbi:MAG TPA: IclR family transcriptional regulator [Chloroflexi bacterium]|nr:IclR family transcriptional regulator [Chloroflexota bacterium]